MLPRKAVIVKGRTTKRKTMKMRKTKKALERTSVASQKKPQMMERKMICAKPNKIAHRRVRKVVETMILSR